MNPSFQSKDSQLAFPKIKTEKKLIHKPNTSNHYYNGKSVVISKKNGEKYSYRNRNENTSKTFYPSWAIFSQKDMGEGSNKLEDKSIQQNYVKNFYKHGSSSYNAYKSTGPSDTGNPVSELTGFKIMRDGKILHDETDKKMDFSDSETDEVQNTKFAASLMTISPNVNNISIPDMAWAD